VIWNGIFINSVKAYLPQRVSLGDIECGMRIDDMNSGFETVTKSDQPEHVMAGLAANDALKQSGYADESLSTIVYATTFQAADHATPACHLQRVLRQRQAFALVLDAASNGGMAGVEVVARLLLTGPAASAGLVSAASRIPGGVDRWIGGTLNGDGAVAAVLSKSGGFARLIASQTSSNPEFEVLFRNRATKLGVWDAEYFETEFGRYVESIAQEVSSVISATLAEADITMQHIAHVTVPAFPLSSLHEIYLDRNSIPLEKTCWPELRRNGHVGPCDQLLGLTYLMDARLLEPGQFVLMIGNGLGFQFTCMLLEIVRP
jgi:3-oxoacyl-[acyl-carrier-protein] synthase III